MISCLRGELISKMPDTLIIDVSGVGYEVRFCQAGLSRLPETGQEIFIHTYLNVREDALDLYGFMEPQEKEMFLILLHVSGIGPKMALNILTACRPSELSRAILTENILSLTKLPGIGKKTAERLCLELKDKVREVAHYEDEPVEDVVLAEDEVTADVLSALQNLGYQKAQAIKALDGVRRGLPENQPEPPLEEILRLTLRSLA